jgi:hypothetical protein
MDDDKINSVIRRLSDLAYPTSPHGIHTQVFHDAINVIDYLRKKTRALKEFQLDGDISND